MIKPSNSTWRSPDRPEPLARKMTPGPALQPPPSSSHFATRIVAFFIKAADAVEGLGWVWRCLN